MHHSAKIQYFLRVLKLNDIEVKKCERVCANDWHQNKLNPIEYKEKNNNNSNNETD